jgi:hypothetical protein
MLIYTASRNEETDVMLKFLQTVRVEALGRILVHLPKGNWMQNQLPCLMKPGQLPRLMRVLEVRANLVLIFFPYKIITVS